MANQFMKEVRESCRKGLFEKRDIGGFVLKISQSLDDSGKTANWLASQLGIKGDTVRSWLSGEKQPSAKYQLMVSQFLGLPYDELVLTPNDIGQYPDGYAVCNTCEKGFVTFDKKYTKNCSRECSNRSQSSRQFGESNPNYKDGKKITDQGYVQLLVGKDHPMAGRGGYVLEHRYVMSQFLDRPLRRCEVIHHLNGNRQDNRIENLELCGKQESTQPVGQRYYDVIKSIMDHKLITGMDIKTRKEISIAIHETIGIPIKGIKKQ